MKGGNSIKTLESDDIVLKDLSLEYADDMYEYAQSYRVGPDSGWESHKSIEETKNATRIMIESNEIWVIYHKVK